MLNHWTHPVIDEYKYAFAATYACANTTQVQIGQEYKVPLNLDTLHRPNSFSRTYKTLLSALTSRIFTFTDC